MNTLDYQTVNQYWSTAETSVLGPYMMDGYGFPISAGRYRFRAECRIVDRLLRGTSRDGCVLDLGSGIGFWAQHFAERFSRVVAVEASRPLYEAMEDRCSQYQSVKMICGDVMLFQPDDQYDVVFLGGMLMYLNDADVIALMEKLIRSLPPGGKILCRETTVRKGTTTRKGDYQAVYRSVDEYKRLFAKCHLSLRTVELNKPYVLMQMGCEFVKKWKELVPRPLQCLPVVGRLVYAGLRVGYPFVSRVLTALGIPWPKLTNHFLMLQPDSLRKSVSPARM
jgi:SAM-dependent methyltransferase